MTTETTETTAIAATQQGGAIVEYGSYDMDAAQHERAELEKGGTDFYEFEVGENQIRIPPPMKGKKTPFTVTFRHVIQFGDKKVFFNCPRKMANLPCPACENADKLYKSGNPADNERAKEWFSKRQVLANVIPRKGDPRVEVARLGKTIYDACISLRENPNFGDFTHPEEGYDILVKRKGKGKNDTEYTVFPCRPSKLGDLTLIGKQKDLSSLAAVPKYEEILAIFKAAKEGKTPEGKGEKEVNPSGAGQSSQRSTTVADDVADGEVVPGGEDIPF